MWQVNNRTPYMTKGSWVRGRKGEEIWTVALKATWDILPDGTTRISSVQSPVNAGSVLHNDGENLLYDTDLGPEKRATDIILNGYALTPDGKKASSVAVGLKVGNMTRLARVYGNRVWNGQQYSTPEPFDRMPLQYNKMSRGNYFPDYMSDFNPAGISVNEPPETGVSTLPNIEFCDDDVTPGFGPLPRQWPGRLQFAGTCDEQWQREQAPLLPTDLDERYWQCAPPPLYAGGRLKGGEVVCLGNLAPPGYGHNGLLIFALPRIIPSFRTQFYNGSVRYHQGRLHTIIIESDFPRVSMVWHSVLPCHHLVNQLESTTVSEKKLLFIRQTRLPVNFPEWEQLL
ncbi:DUF2169 domain-containing protein [Salmonella enterica]|nr:DUF2169 domain-containing protein [Salmonella enterica]ECC1743785.1 DUF2169 domain-containing protein [Salmonella enterica subsp. salamae]MBA3001602.1 DUF2169 domain-containing protein [Salmonella enterica subsp. salamae serovar 3,10:b:e,n,x]EHI7817665.1 DUF2169 domain-containing protein [Salmonella enterica]EHJ0755051.1 DUF2169 domain-containing protein [Salmonella enterica]